MSNGTEQIRSTGYAGSVLKAKILSRQHIAGTHITLGDPAICEMISYLGFDFIWVDTEHSPLDLGPLKLHLMAAKAGDTPVIVRVPWNDPVMIKRVIDMGPAGVVIPMVNTAEEARRAVNACRYPPEGNRGWGPYGAIRYGLDNQLKWIHETSWDMCIFAQVEHIQAVKNLREIADVEGIDGFVFGPCDLSGSVGELYKMYESKTVSVIDEAIAILREKGKYIAVSCGNTPEVLEFWHSRGVHMISAGMDYSFILSGAEQTLKNIKNAQN